MRTRRATACLRLLAAVALGLALAACSAGGSDDDGSAAEPGGSHAGTSQGTTFTFGVIGDYPYSPDQNAQFDRLIEAVNGEQPAFVLHLGDIGAQVCTDDAVTARLALLRRFTMPVIYTPGDNEWADCHEAAADPLQRLSRLRQLAFPSDQSLGERTLTVARQGADFPENARFQFGGVTFVSVHQVGSKNGTGRDAAGDAEVQARVAANLAWVGAGFEAATSTASKGIVVFFQADPNFDLYGVGVRNAHTDLLRTLEREAVLYRRPVLLVHGDTHVFRVDKALLGSADRRPIENVTRLENFGSPDVHWSRVTVDASRPDLFSFSPAIVGANLVEHTPPR